MEIFESNYNHITQEYLESVYKASTRINKLVNLVLSRALEDAKNGNSVSRSYIHKDEFDYETLKLACEELQRRKFRVNWSHEQYTSTEGYIGEIQINFIAL
ncbi:hypothetical protein [Lysinibacillus sp. NPDC086135]|uniref:hypothetical protein n=1 Tax=Lysinibacillus sp. NPDC086135 TaxID=3364130 RepID=UPI003805A398